MRYGRAGFGLASAFVAVLSSPLCAQNVQNAADYPSRPVRVVTSQATGGATDVQARLFAQKLTQNLHRQFFIENIPGAESVAGGSAVAKSAPDGYTILVITPTFTIAPALQPNLPFDTINDFAEVSLLTRSPYLMVVNVSVPVNSVKDLVALAKAQPGKLNFGAGNTGSNTHLTMLWFLKQAGIKGQYIPYKGVGQAMIDLIGGHIDGTMSSPLSMLPHIKAGKLKALGISSVQRSAVMPDIPTLKEQGVDCVVSSYHGWVVPAATPAAIVSKLNIELNKAVNAPDIAGRLREEGLDPVGSTPDELRQIVVSEVPRWKKLIQDEGIKPE